MADVRYAPLRKWPGTPTPATARKAPLFRVTLAATLKALAGELDAIGVRQADLLVDVGADDISEKGKLLARPAQPGIVLAFEKPGRAGAPGARVTMPHDVYMTWEANVRGAVLTLEALRAVNRHGGAPNDEQYRGYAALPAPGGVNTTAVTLTPERAARIVVDAHPGGAMLGGGDGAAALLLSGQLDVVARFVREAKIAAAGSDAAATVNAAADVLLRHRGLR